MKRLKITMKVGTNEEIFIMDRRNDQAIPSNDYIINEYSHHYHLGTKGRSLPKTVEVLKIEEV